MLPSIVWDGSPDIYQLGFLKLRWYNLLFLTPFLVSMPLWYKMFAKAGRTLQEADILRTYIMIGVMAGARLGHVIFYQWDYYSNHLLEIFLPVTFTPKFKVVGFCGLASHGAAIGILIAVFLYAKRVTWSLSPFKVRVSNRSHNTPILWIGDNLVILIALGAGCIRIGNFMNSEIIGKPTNGTYGVVFARDISKFLLKAYPSDIHQISVAKSEQGELPSPQAPYQSIALKLRLHSSLASESRVVEFLEGPIKGALVHLSQVDMPMVNEVYGTHLSYTLHQCQDGTGYTATVYTRGILRHPAQLYEALSCVLIFLGLLTWWTKRGAQLPPGRMAGTFLLFLFVLRFFYENCKENQVDFENAMSFNMGQLLSLPFIIFGLCLIFRPIPRAPKK